MSESGALRPELPSVCIVILNWNGWRDTLTCLDSLNKLAYGRFETVVVDNGSTDGSLAHLERRTDQITLLSTTENLGFAGGCNVGVRYALQHGHDFVWLLNNDTRVHSQALSELVHTAMLSAKIGAVGSVLRGFDEDQHIQAWGGGKVHFWNGRITHHKVSVQQRELHFLIGASILLRRQALEQGAMLDDETFFLYWEDTDLGFRLRSAGWRLAVAGESVVWHKESASTSQFSEVKHRYMGVSAVRFFKRHAPLPLWSIFMAISARVLKRILQRQWKCARALSLGAWEELSARPSIYRQVPRRMPLVRKIPA